MGMARFRIDVTDDRQLREVESLVTGRTRVYGTSSMFGFVATGDLAPDLQDRIRALGASIVPDVQYTLDEAG